MNDNQRKSPPLKKLKKRELLFAEAIINEKSQIDAFNEAGYTAENITNAYAKAHRLIRTKRIRLYIEEQRKRIDAEIEAELAKSRIYPADIIEGLKHIAFDKKEDGGWKEAARDRRTALRDLGEYLKMFTVQHEGRMIHEHDLSKLSAEELQRVIENPDVVLSTWN